MLHNDTTIINRMSLVVRDLRVTIDEMKRRSKTSYGHMNGVKALVGYLSRFDFPQVGRYFEIYFLSCSVS